MGIPDVHDFYAARAAKELLTVGYTAVDDISGQLVDCAEAELFDALGFAGDGLELAIDEIDTSFGPVFVFRDRRRVSLETVKAFVFKHRPEPPSLTPRPSAT